MKILFAYYIPSGGVETLARQRSLSLKKHGIQFDFLYFSYGPGIQNLVNEKVYITKEVDGFKKILADGNYDAILVCSDHLFVKTLRDIGYQGKIIYEIQGLGSKRQANHWLINARGYISEYADAILSPQTPHLVSLIRKYFPAKRHFCFHNCINLDTFHYRELPPEPNPIIGWVGRIEDNKNWSDALLITAALKAVKQELELWIFEDPSLANPVEKIKFEAKVDELGLRTAIRFFGNIPHHEMPDYFSRIGSSGGFLCSTSKVEGFGYAVLEAMSCRCPVLCSDSDGVRSIIIHNETGKMYPSLQVKEAIDEGTDLLLNLPSRARLIQSALIHIQANFSPEVYAQNFLSMVNELNLK